MFDLKKTKIAVIGLGYVGLPLAVELSNKYPVIGYDISKKRISELENHQDVTQELTKEVLKCSTSISYTTSIEELKNCNVFIVTVPTPVDIQKKPNLNPLIDASRLVGNVIKKGGVVIYESTVYPGATEDTCIPEVEKNSGLKFNHDFFAGYSPERINPGDKINKLVNIKKVTSGSNEEVANYIDSIYKSIIKAGTHKAKSIKVAEAAKLIENVQRDVNISLINELFQIFNLMGIDINEVVDAASTKWNFMKLYPGFVGGHCIGVDPYYLLHKTGQIGYVPDLIRTAREINDSMPSYIAVDFLKKLLLKNINPVGQVVNLLGFTFKENCPDIRNTKIYELYKELLAFGFEIKIIDPIVNTEEVMNVYKLNVVNNVELHDDSICLLAVGHTVLIEYIKNKNVKYIYDFKGYIKENENN